LRSIQSKEVKEKGKEYRRRRESGKSGNIDLEMAFGIEEESISEKIPANEETMKEK